MDKKEITQYEGKFVELEYKPNGVNIINKQTGTIKGVFNGFIVFQYTESYNDLTINITSIKNVNEI